jgi:hypothetical protein
MLNSRRPRKAFNGLALLIIRSKPGEAGPIHVTASGANLASGEIVINTQP